jgi:hypothetical protein
MDARLGRGRQVDDLDGPGARLVAIADALDASGEQYCASFAEMVLADMSAEPHTVCPVRAATELLLEPMTSAEATAAKIMFTAAVHARDARLDDESLRRLMTLATVYVARFESYLAERSVPDPE